MKDKLHPHWVECQVTCACGNTFTTHATVATMQVDICNKCHPFFTGEARFVDKEGRLDKFKNKMALSQKLQAVQKSKQAAKHAKKMAEAAAKNMELLSFKQVLGQAKRVSDQAAKLKKTLPKTSPEKKTTAKKVAPEK